MKSRGRAGAAEPVGTRARALRRGARPARERGEPVGVWEVGGGHRVGSGTWLVVSSESEVSK